VTPRRLTAAGRQRFASQADNSPNYPRLRQAARRRESTRIAIVRGSKTDKTGRVGAPPHGKPMTNSRRKFR
jgi:hypothetical protein